MGTYMKKIISKIVSLVVAVVIMAATLVGCGEETNTGNYIPTKSDGKTTKLVLDETATGKLNLDFWGVGSMNSDDPNQMTDIGMAVSKFQQLYPNVKVNVNYSGFDVDIYDYTQKIATHVMAGEGPDLFYVDYGMDANKIMESGKLADMSEFFVNDPYFSFDDMNKKLFEAGQRDGKQYLVPTGATIPWFMTSEEALDKYKIDIAKCSDYYGFANEIGAEVKRNPQMKEPINCFVYLGASPEGAGLKWIDYETKTVNVNNEEMKNVLATVKNQFGGLITDTITSNYAISFAKQIEDGETLLANAPESMYYFMNQYVGLDANSDAVLLPWRDINGNIEAELFKPLAVNNSSKNKENAYRFIKIFLSEEYYDNIRTIETLYGVPVNKNVIKNYAKERIDDETKSERFLTNYQGIVDDIDIARYNTQADTMLHAVAFPYLKGEKTFEESFPTLQEQLELYISE